MSISIIDECLQNTVMSTCIATTINRAKENLLNEKERLFSDEYAVGALEIFKKSPFYEQYLEMMNTNDMLNRFSKNVIPRTKWFDDKIINICNSHENIQVVILGCGLDGRCFRLPLPTSHVFYVDQEPVINMRTYIQQTVNLEHKCRSFQEICYDLSQPLDGLEQKLKLNGFNPELPSLWLLEGLLMYLMPLEVESLFNFCNKMNASYILGIQLSIYTLHNVQKNEQHPVIGSFKSGLDSNFHSFLNSIQFDIQEIVTLNGKYSNYGRREVIEEMVQKDPIDGLYKVLYSDIIISFLFVITKMEKICK